jgi:NitT/TauT family transport system substrate-binding protein/putative hydroxymethylpyrimidine transport system substrate-binding protein
MLPRLMRLAALATAVAAAAVMAAGCGSAGHRAQRDATLVLDFTPNAVHAGVYSALARHYDRRKGVRLHVIVPSASTDSIKLLESGRAQFAILDIHDLAIARERGSDIVGIMAIVERPLASLIAAPRFPTPRSLTGQTVGITGVPSDTAVLRSIVAGAGGDPARLRTVTIGFSAVAELLAGKVAAATAFWNDEGVTIEHRRRGFHIFRVDADGAPSYPELVLCATRQRLVRDPRLARAVVGALIRGYATTRSDPSSAAADLESQVPGLDRTLVSAELDVLTPAFAGPSGAEGELGERVLRAWAKWETRFGIVRRAPDVARTFDTRFLSKATSLTH